VPSIKLANHQPQIASRKLNARNILYDMPALRRMAKSPGKQFKFNKYTYPKTNRGLIGLESVKTIY